MHKLQGGMEMGVGEVKGEKVISGLRSKRKHSSEKAMKGFIGDSDRGAMPAGRNREVGAAGPTG